MKYILTTIILFFGALSYAQPNVEDNNIFPKYAVDTASGRMGIMFSIQQAQKIDNDYDLLSLLEKQKIGCDTVIKSYRIAVMDLDKVVASQDIKIEQLDSLNTANNELINNLKEQIRNYITDKIKCDSLVGNKDAEIKLLNKQIFKLKVQKIVGFTGLAVFGGVSVGVSVYAAYMALLKH